MTCVAMQFKSTRALKSMLAKSKISWASPIKGGKGMRVWGHVPLENCKKIAHHSCGKKPQVYERFCFHGIILTLQAVSISSDTRKS